VSLTSDIVNVTYREAETDNSSILKYHSLVPHIIFSLYDGYVHYQRIIFDNLFNLLL